MEAVKKPWFSKTLLVNMAVALLAVTGLSTKIDISAESMMMALSGINIILRLVTKDKIGLIE